MTDNANPSSIARRTSTDETHNRAERTATPHAQKRSETYLHDSGNAHELYISFNDTPTNEIYTLSLHDALPISSANKPLALSPRLKTLTMLESSSTRSIIRLLDLLSIPTDEVFMHDQDKYYQSI